MGTRVGLVLGGGGVRGAAWLMGALHGLVAETGWDPASADLLVGTSAGAIVATLTAAGTRPWDVLAPDRGDFYRALMGAAAFRPELSLRSVGPGSLSLAGAGLRSWPGHLMKVVAGLLPQGFVSTGPIVSLVRERAPDGWPSPGGLWIVAVDYATGERIPFGRAGAHDAELALAVAASCAIPGFFCPVSIGSRLYVDGGVNSGANLDLVAGAGLDLVICANPLSSPSGLGLDVVSSIRALLHRQLESQVRAVERSGTRVIVLEPQDESVRLIGMNPLSRRRGAAIGGAAVEEVRQYLRRPAIKRQLGRLGKCGPIPAA